MKLSPSTGSAHPRTSAKHWEGVVAEDIPHGWMDDMVKRLFEMINRDMIRLETAQLKANTEKGPDGKPLPEDLDAAMASVAKQERLVAQIQRSMERLSAMEFKRQPSRKHIRRKKTAVSNDNSLEQLECNIAKLAAAGRTPEDSSGSHT